MRGKGFGGFVEAGAIMVEKIQADRLPAGVQLPEQVLLTGHPESRR